MNFPNNTRIILEPFVWLRRLPLCASGITEATEENVQSDTKVLVSLFSNPCDPYLPPNLKVSCVHQDEYEGGQASDLSVISRYSVSTLPDRPNEKCHFSEF